MEQQQQQKRVLLVLFVWSSLFISLLISSTCSTSISSSSSPPPPPAPQLKIGLKRVGLSLVLGLFTGCLTAIFVALTIRCFVRYINTTPVLKGPVVFSPKIDPRTLQFALDNDNHLLGSGAYYRAALDNGLTIAVKRLEPFEIASPHHTVKRKLQKHLQLLAALRHRNLMTLRAYVHDSHQFTLIYDYMPTGSLEDALNRLRLGGDDQLQLQLQLGWDVRLRIALGIVKALKFLHFDCTPCILHYNLKPSNVMLDAEYEPKLADYGLAKLMPKLYRSTAADGYKAPESSHNCRYTDKSDVFSFGVMLGVLLTGRDPLDPFFGEEGNGGTLGTWLRHLQQAGEPHKALDKSILGPEIEVDEMLMAVRIAVVCMSDVPEDRPSTDELVPMLSRLHSF